MMLRIISGLCVFKVRRDFNSNVLASMEPRPVETGDDNQVAAPI